VSSIKNVNTLCTYFVASLVLQSPISLNIHNQGQSINLTSPVYSIHGGKWHVVPDQEIDVNAVMRNRIEFDSGQDILEGALVYRLQKMETSFSEIKRGTQKKRAKIDKPIQDESKHIQLLVAWHVEHTKELRVRALLVEHDGELDEDKLRILHQKYWHLFNAQIDPIKSNWQLNDTTVLTTTITAMNGGCRWNISIAEEKGSNDKRPLWFDITK
jgi:hypothetical protein